MKFFGKLAAALLSLSFCFSAFGCADLTTPPPTGNSGNSDSGSSEQEQTQTTGESLANAIMGQLEEANTLTFSLELKTSQDDVYKAEEDKIYNYFDEEILSYEYTFAKTATGYNMIAEASRTEKWTNENGELETHVESATSYIIDGVTYEYDEDCGGYIYNPYENTYNTFMETLNAIGASIKTEEIDQFKAMLGEALTEVYDVTEGNISFAYDAKDDINALFDYVAAIDPETKTIESILNDALALIDEELTVAAILAEIEKLDSVTLGEAVTAIDAYLTENADTTLQGLKDEFFTDEKVIALLQAQDMPADALKTAQDAVLADLIEPHKNMLLDEIVYNVVAPMIIGEFDPERNTYEAFLNEVLANAPEEIKEMGVDSFITYLTKCAVSEALNMPIAQLAGEESEYLYEIISTFDSFTMNDFSADMNVEFNEYFQIETISANGNIELVTDDEMCTSTQNATFAFSIDSISKNTTEITLPEDIELVFAFWKNDTFLENNSGILLWWPGYDAETGEYYDTIGSIDLDGDGFDDINFSYEAPTEVTNTWEITITEIMIGDYSYTDDELATLLDGDLTYTLTFDFDETGDYITDFVMPVLE